MILDTVHYLPGELLDFIACLPYLSNKAVIILDDLYFCHGGENVKAVATRVLYSSVVADRLYPLYEENSANMQAFQLNKETVLSEDNLFQALLLPWYYDMSDEEMESYYKIIQHNYNAQLVELFSYAVKVNKKTLQKQADISRSIKELLLLFTQKRPVYIYGAGKRGSALGKFLQSQGREISGYVISNGRDKETFSHLHKEVFYPDEIPSRQTERILILAAADETIRRFLQKSRIAYWEAPNYIFPFIKKYVDILLL